MSATQRETEALGILKTLGFPRAQQNDRSALCLLALLDLTPKKTWNQAKSPLMGITPIMDWIKQHYGKDYAPNTRETVRRQTMHQFRDAGIALYNPDDPKRPVNSPKAVYQIEPLTLELLRTFGSDTWEKNLKAYKMKHPGLAEQYANAREMAQLPVVLENGQTFQISPGAHSELIKAIVEEFASRYAPGSVLIYVGDTGSKRGYFDKETLEKLGVFVDSHGKMPDVVLWDEKRNWVFLVEAVTSHGPVDGKRHRELEELFSDCTAGTVYVTAFPNFATMNQYLPAIDWETEVWLSEHPTHLIHFNGDRFLGPYKKREDS